MDTIGILYLCHVQSSALNLLFSLLSYSLPILIFSLILAQLEGCAIWWGWMSWSHYAFSTWYKVCANCKDIGK